MATRELSGCDWRTTARPSMRSFAMLADTEMDDREPSAEHAPPTVPGEREAVEALIQPAVRQRLQQCAGGDRASNAASRWGTPGSASPSRPSPNREWMPSGPGGIARKTRSFRKRPPAPAAQRRQPEERRLERVRPSPTCRACHRSTCGRSQSLTRPWPRSTTGCGMSSYVRWYWKTVLRWESPRMSATTCASTRSSVATRGDTESILHV
jgi:hypothetical protein